MKVLIIGESCCDAFVYGSVTRICPEAPVPVFCPTRKTQSLGMAANVFQNIQAIAYHEGDTKSVFRLVSNVSKGTKTRYVDEASNQMIMREDTDEYTIIPDIKTVDFDKYDAVIVSDYNKGFLSDKDLSYISKQCAERKLPCFLDTKKKFDKESMSDFSFIKINRKEYIENGFEEADKAKLIVTLGSQGCVYDGELFPCQSTQVFDVSGAGDTFLAAFVYEYMTSKNIDKAIDFAQKCCSIVVAKKGVCTI